jgi:hydrogen peroxide-dependent heme synthase
MRPATGRMQAKNAISKGVSNPMSDSTYTAFWLYKARSNWRRTLENIFAGDDSKAHQDFVSVLNKHSDNVHLRGAYSTVGYRHDVDMILWVVTQDPDALQRLAVDLNKSDLGQSLDMVYCYIGVAGSSQYDKTHGPAFMKGTPPSRYLSVYPFTKTPDWFLVSFEERRDMMKYHGQLGNEFPTILTNTVNSFGIQDQEFIVALEDDDPSILVKMVQRLREAEVRKYTALDTPIFLGQRKDLADVLKDLS